MPSLDYSSAEGGQQRLEAVAKAKESPQDLKSKLAEYRQTYVNEVNAQKGSLQSVANSFKTDEAKKFLTDSADKLGSTVNDLAGEGEKVQKDAIKKKQDSGKELTAAEMNFQTLAQLKTAVSDEITNETKKLPQYQEIEQFNAVFDRELRTDDAQNQASSIDGLQVNLATKQQRLHVLVENNNKMVDGHLPYDLTKLFHEDYDQLINRIKHDIGAGEVLVSVKNEMGKQKTEMASMESKLSAKKTLTEEEYKQFVSDLNTKDAAVAEQFTAMQPVINTQAPFLDPVTKDFSRQVYQPVSDKLGQLHTQVEARRPKEVKDADVDPEHAFMLKAQEARIKVETANKEVSNLEKELATAEKHKDVYLSRPDYEAWRTRLNIQIKALDDLTPEFTKEQNNPNEAIKNLASEISVKYIGPAAERANTLLTKAADERLPKIEAFEKEFINKKVREMADQLEREWQGQQGNTDFLQIAETLQGVDENSDLYKQTKAGQDKLFTFILGFEGKVNLLLTKPDQLEDALAAQLRGLSSEVALWEQQITGDRTVIKTRQEATKQPKQTHVTPAVYTEEWVGDGEGGTMVKTLVSPEKKDDYEFGDYIQFINALDPNNTDINEGKGWVWKKEGLPDDVKTAFAQQADIIVSQQKKAAQDEGDTERKKMEKDNRFSEVVKEKLMPEAKDYYEAVTLLSKGEIPKAMEAYQRYLTASESFDPDKKALHKSCIEDAQRQLDTNKDYPEFLQAMKAMSDQKMDQALPLFRAFIAKINALPADKQKEYTEQIDASVEMIRQINMGKLQMLDSLSKDFIYLMTANFCRNATPQVVNPIQFDKLDPTHRRIMLAYMPASMLTAEERENVKNGKCGMQDSPEVQAINGEITTLRAKIAKGNPPVNFEEEFAAIKEKLKKFEERQPGATMWTAPDGSIKADGAASRLIAYFDQINDTDPKKREAGFVAIANEFKDQEVGMQYTQKYLREAMSTQYQQFDKENGGKLKEDVRQKLAADHKITAEVEAGANAAWPQWVKEENARLAQKGEPTIPENPPDPIIMQSLKERIFGSRLSYEYEREMRKSMTDRAKATLEKWQSEHGGLWMNLSQEEKKKAAATMENGDLILSLDSGALGGYNTSMPYDADNARWYKPWSWQDYNEDEWNDFKAKSLEMAVQTAVTLPIGMGAGSIGKLAGTGAMRLLAGAGLGAEAVETLATGGIRALMTLKNEAGELVWQGLSGGLKARIIAGYGIGIIAEGTSLAVMNGVWEGMSTGHSTMFDALDERRYGAASLALLENIAKAGLFRGMGSLQEGAMNLAGPEAGTLAKIMAQVGGEAISGAGGAGIEGLSMMMHGTGQEITWEWFAKSMLQNAAQSLGTHLAHGTARIPEEVFNDRSARKIQEASLQVDLERAGVKSPGNITRVTAEGAIYTLSGNIVRVPNAEFLPPSMRSRFNELQQAAQHPEAAKPAAPAAKTNEEPKPNEPPGEKKTGSPYRDRAEVPPEPPTPPEPRTTPEGSPPAAPEVVHTPETVKTVLESQGITKPEDIREVRIAADGTLLINGEASTIKPADFNKLPPEVSGRIQEGYQKAHFDTLLDQSRSLSDRQAALDKATNKDPAEVTALAAEKATLETAQREAARQLDAQIKAEPADSPKLPEMKARKALLDIETGKVTAESEAIGADTLQLRLGISPEKATQLADLRTEARRKQYEQDLAPGGPLALDKARLESELTTATDQPTKDRIKTQLDAIKAKADFLEFFKDPTNFDKYPNKGIRALAEGLNKAGVGMEMTDLLSLARRKAAGEGREMTADMARDLMDMRTTIGEPTVLEATGKPGDYSEAMKDTASLSTQQKDVRAAIRGVDPNDPVKVKAALDQITNPADRLVMQKAFDDLNGITAVNGKDALTPAEKQVILDYSVGFLAQYRAAGGFGENLNINDIFTLVRDNQRKIAHQSAFDKLKLVGSDHGVVHVLEGNMKQAEALMDNMNMNPKDRVLAMQALVDHDMGYTMEGIRNKSATTNLFELSKDHPLYSTLYVEGNRAMYEKYFGKEGYQIIHDAVLDHSAVGNKLDALKAPLSDTNLNSMAIKAIVSIVDCAGTTANVKNSTIYQHPEIIGSMQKLRQLKDNPPTQDENGNPLTPDQQKVALRREAQGIIDEMKRMVDGMEGVDQATKDIFANSIRDSLQAGNFDFPVSGNLGMYGAAMRGLELSGGQLNYNMSFDPAMQKAIIESHADRKAGEDVSVQGIKKALKDFGFDDKGLTTQAQKDAFALAKSQLDKLSKGEFPEGSTVEIVTPQGVKFNIKVEAIPEYAAVRETLSRNNALNKLRTEGMSQLAEGMAQLAAADRGVLIENGTERPATATEIAERKSDVADSIDGSVTAAADAYSHLDITLEGGRKASRVLLEIKTQIERFKAGEISAQELNVAGIRSTLNEIFMRGGKLSAASASERLQGPRIESMRAELEAGGIRKAEDVSKVEIAADGTLTINGKISTIKPTEIDRLPPEVRAAVQERYVKAELAVTESRISELFEGDYKDFEALDKEMGKERTIVYGKMENNLGRELRPEEKARLDRRIDDVRRAKQTEIETRLGKTRESIETELKKVEAQRQQILEDIFLRLNPEIIVVNREQGIYRIEGKDAQGNDTSIYGSLFSILDTSKSVNDIRQIASLVGATSVPGCESSLVLSGSGAQREANPYPTDIDLAEHMVVSGAKNREEMGIILAENITKNLAKAKEGGMEFTEMKLGVNPDGLEANMVDDGHGGTKNANKKGVSIKWSMEEIEAGRKQMKLSPNADTQKLIAEGYKVSTDENGNKIITIDLNKAAENPGMFKVDWRGFDSDGLLTEITKVIYVEAPKVEGFAGTTMPSAPLQEVHLLNPDFIATMENSRDAGVIRDYRKFLSGDAAKYGAEGYMLKTAKRLYNEMKIEGRTDLIPEVDKILRSDFAKLNQIQDQLSMIGAAIQAGTGLSREKIVSQLEATSGTLDRLNISDAVKIKAQADLVRIREQILRLEVNAEGKIQSDEVAKMISNKNKDGISNYLSSESRQNINRMFLENPALVTYLVEVNMSNKQTLEKLFASFDQATLRMIGEKYPELVRNNLTP